MKLFIKENDNFYYTNLIDGIYSTLKREFGRDERFLDIKKVHGPNGCRQAVRVEVEVDHPYAYGNTLFPDVFYVCDQDGVITVWDDDSKRITCVDLEALVNYFYDRVD